MIDKAERLLKDKVILLEEEIAQLRLELAEERERSDRRLTRATKAEDRIKELENEE